jgi:hypothetical protein
MIGAAIVIFALLAGPAFIFVNLPQSISPTTPTNSPTNSPTNTPTSALVPTQIPSPTPVGVPGVSWTNASAEFSGVDFVGAAQIGTSLVVVGNPPETSAYSDPTIAIYDGSTWTTVKTSPVFANSRIDWLINVPGALLAVGESTLPDPDCPTAGADPNGCIPMQATLMWTSPDGQAWFPLAASELAPFKRVWIVTMGAGTDGLIAYGVYSPIIHTNKQPISDVVLRSTDGITWTSYKPTGTAMGPTGVWAQDITSTSSGFVAIGTDGKTWSSTNGQAWKAANTPTPGSDLWPGRNIAVAKDGMLAGSQGWWATVAATSSDLVIGPLWTSADGHTWTSAQWATPGGAPLIFAGDGMRIVALGASGSNVYWTTDAKTWISGPSLGTPPTATDMANATPDTWLLPSWVVVTGAAYLYIGSITG